METLTAIRDNVPWVCSLIWVILMWKLYKSQRRVESMTYYKHSLEEQKSHIDKEFGKRLKAIKEETHGPDGPPVA